MGKQDRHRPRLSAWFALRKPTETFTYSNVAHTYLKQKHQSNMFSSQAHRPGAQL